MVSVDGVICDIDAFAAFNKVQHGVNIVRRSASDLAEEGGAVLGHLRRVLVELQWLCDVVHEGVGLIRLLLGQILHLALQQHQAAVPRVQLVPNTLENRGGTV